MSTDLDSVLVPNELCPVREVGSGLVLMAPEGTATHSLDEIGAFIWRQLDGRRDLAGVVEALIAEYDVDAAQAGDDVRAFVSQLVEAGLVRIAC
jgi:hypothetical protein